MNYHFPPGIPQASVVPPRARLATSAEARKDSLKKFPESINTAYCALAHGHGKDHGLARLNDTTRTLGVATIAGLGSLGISQPGGALPLWLGGASWLTAMAVTPKIINGAVYAKTGVNLNTKYLSSNGEVRRLYLDPNYLPLQVISPEKQQAMMRRLGVPVNHPERQSLLERKLKQISVQAHTWWMLMAGMATPVIASLICNRLEDPMKDWVSRLRHQRAMDRLMKPALASKNAEHLVHALESTVNATIGSGTEVTVLSRWWKQFPESVVKTLGLNNLSQQELLHPSKEARFDRIVAHMEQQLRQPQSRQTLTTLLGHQQEKLNKVLAPLEELLNNPAVKENVPRATLLKIEQEVQLARHTADATLQHFRQILKMPLGKIPEKTAQAMLKQRMEKAVLAYVEQLNRTGEVTKAAEAAGGPEQFKRVMGSFRNFRYAPAFRQMGDSPKSFILRATESMALERRWFRRFPGFIGGGMLATTALFMLFVLGKDFGKPKGGRA